MYTDRDGKKGKPFIIKHDVTLLMQQDMTTGQFSSLPGLLVLSMSQKGGFNTKYRQDYRDKSFDPETRKDCTGESYSANCVVYIDGKVTATLPEIGNFLIGYNFNYAGFTLDNMNGSFYDNIYSAGLITEELKRSNVPLFNPKKSNDSIENEYKDRPFYNAGFNYAEQEKQQRSLPKISDFFNNF